jgi:hypothetical protein
MSLRCPYSDIQVAEVGRSDTMTTKYMSITEALNLVSPFSRNKEILTFVSNVDTAFSYLSPEKRSRFYKFILTKISCEPRITVSHRKEGISQEHIH